MRTMPLGLEHISVERHSAVEGKHEVSCRLNHKKESVNQRNGRDAPGPRAGRGTAACVEHHKTA